MVGLSLVAFSLTLYPSGYLIIKLCLFSKIRKKANITKNRSPGGARRYSLQSGFYGRNTLLRIKDRVPPPFRLAASGGSLNGSETVRNRLTGVSVSWSRIDVDTIVWLYEPYRRLRECSVLLIFHDK